MSVGRVAPRLLYKDMEGYTKINNELLEAITRWNLTSAEIRILLCLIRRLDGFHKENDEVSISQFMRHTGLSNRGVLNTLKRLQLMNICSLVKKGKSKKSSNEWAIEHNPGRWKPMNRSSLVNFPTSTSELSGNKLVNLSSHTKESIQKKYIQKKESYKKSIEYMKSQEHLDHIRSMDTFKDYAVGDIYFKTQCEAVVMWAESKGKKIKSYPATLQGFIKRDIEAGKLILKK